MNACRAKGAALHVSTYKAIVRDYIRNHRADANRLLRFYAIQRSLADAIDKAAFALLPSEKRHPHQYRIPGAVLARVRARLRRTDLSGIKTFDELHGRVDDAIGYIRGVGELMIYDTAHRIGAFLNMEPDLVYLHAGTREGARALGFSRDRRTLPMSELPREFRALKPHEIEDCLCIYKSVLMRISNRTPKGRR